MRYRQIIAGLAGLALMAGCGPPALAATNPLTYTVSVSGSWSGSWTVTPTHGGYTSESAPSIDVPANKAYTAHGDLVVTIPALPSGYQYYGSWSMSNPGMLSNAWCGNGANYVDPVFAIPASGGTITEPLSKIWGTMPATSSGVAPCDIAIQPPVIASASGSEKSQFNTLDLALGVHVVQPKPKPSPSKSASPSPSKSVSPTPSKSKSTSPSKSTTTSSKTIPLTATLTGAWPGTATETKTLHGLATPTHWPWTPSGMATIRGTPGVAWSVLTFPGMNAAGACPAAPQQTNSLGGLTLVHGTMPADGHVTFLVRKLFGTAKKSGDYLCNLTVTAPLTTGSDIYANVGVVLSAKPAAVAPTTQVSPSPSPSQQPTQQPKPVTHHAVVHPKHHKHPTTPPFPWWILVIAVVLGGTWYWVWRRRGRRQSE